MLLLLLLLTTCYESWVGCLLACCGQLFGDPGSAGVEGLVPLLNLFWRAASQLRSLMLKHDLPQVIFCPEMLLRKGLIDCCVRNGIEGLAKRLVCWCSDVCYLILCPWVQHLSDRLMLGVCCGWGLKGATKRFP